MGGFRAVGDTIGEDYARLEAQYRGDMQMEMYAELSCLSGCGGAKMRWTVSSYYEYVFKRYRIKLVGWPRSIPFMNLSNVTGRTRIMRLSERWHTGKMHFEPVSDAELEAARKNPVSIAPGPLNYGMAKKLSRSDIKKRRAPVKKGFRLRYVRNGPKSARLVTAMAEARAEREIAVERAAMEVDEIESFTDDENRSFLRAPPVKVLRTRRSLCFS